MNKETFYQNISQVFVSDTVPQDAFNVLERVCQRISTYPLSARFPDWIQKFVSGSMWHGGAGSVGRRAWTSSRVDETGGSPHRGGSLRAISGRS